MEKPLSTELQALFDEALTLKSTPGGHHLHLDELLSDPPAPGLRDWLPIIDQLGHALVETGDPWVISFRLGTTPEFRLPDDRDGLFEIADASELLEPPEVRRRRRGDTFYGQEFESTSCSRQIAPRIFEKFSVSRWASDRDQGLPYDVMLYRAINGFGDDG